MGWEHEQQHMRQRTEALNPPQCMSVLDDARAASHQHRGMHSSCLPFACVQFEDEGCENCSFLDLKGDRGRVADYTTPNFSG